MGKNMTNSRGFTLIASLLMLVMLSGISIGLLFLVSGRGRAGGNDLESNVAYYGAESGMEKLTADVAALYQAFPSPTPVQLNALATNPPDNTQISAMTYVESVSFQIDPLTGKPQSFPSLISQGPNEGLTASIIPLTLQVNATRPSGANANITRGVEVALIPVFQFGVFSDSDLSYYAGPQFGFQGRVHTNGNLFLAANNGPLILDGKVTAVGEIVRDTLANNYSTAGSYHGSVFVPNATGGCDTFLAGGAQGPNCLDFGSDNSRATNDASWTGGAPPKFGAATQPPSGPGSWYNSSTGRFNRMVGNNASIGVTTLQLPFVQGNVSQQVQIIRKPTTVGESPTGAIGSSREFNKANIRILLGDNQNELHPDGLPGDAFDVQLETLGGITVANTGGVPSFFAVADPANSGNDPNLIVPRCAPNGNAAAPYPNPAGVCNPYAPPGNKWPLVRGWLRVEYRNAAGNWKGVTQEWLNYGFAKTSLPRSAPAIDINGHRDAILIFQQLADRDGNGQVIDSNTIVVGAQTHVVEKTSITGQNWNFYPINFHDPREGYPRNAVTLAGTQCYVNGIMNAVELDVGNLNLWLKKTGDFNGGTGNLVDPSSQNGYLLYFSDRRGMEPDPNPPANGVTYGVSGLEDVINTASGAAGTPDGVLDPKYSTANSPEDVDLNGFLDNWGAVNLGDGFGINTGIPVGKPNPYVAIDCMAGGRQNWVSGARHVLRLVDGSLGNVPMQTAAAGGFTVASENPVYVWGDYNSSVADPFWGNQNAADIPHAAAAIIADAVTLLSNSYADLTVKIGGNFQGNLQNTVSDTNRKASNTYYRMAIAGGKNMNFQNFTATADFGEDGGVHNFLRYIENWGGPTLSYRGSLVSLYYSQYATGTYKSSGAVYSPPNRNYFFDTEFLIPANLPPGTPELQDVNNLTYWQNYQAY